MSRILDRTKDIFLDTMLLGNEILSKKIKTVNKTKITIVLTSFRSVNSLEKILKNINDQNFTEYEIIVVDDLVETEIEEYIVSHDNDKLNYIKKQLGSSSSAKNCALTFAKGDYIIFMEDNVELNNNYLNLLYSKATEDNLDITITTKSSKFNKLTKSVVNGQEYLVDEIMKFKSSLDYNLTSCMFKKKFLDVYELQFEESILSLENLYFKLRCFDNANKVAKIEEVTYRELLEEKTVRNNAMIEASTRRIMHVMNKIEQFKEDKSYKVYLNLLCGYLWLDVLRMHDDMAEEDEIIAEIKAKKNYFAKDSLVNRTLLALSPVTFANYLNTVEKE